MIDFEKTLTLLSDAGVRFVIIGGLAVTIHGSSYVTFDLYLCYARDDENLARLSSLGRAPAAPSAPLDALPCLQELPLLQALPEGRRRLRRVPEAT